MHNCLEPLRRARSGEGALALTLPRATRNPHNQPQSDSQPSPFLFFYSKNSGGSENLLTSPRPLICRKRKKRKKETRTELKTTQKIRIHKKETNLCAPQLRAGGARRHRG